MKKNPASIERNATASAEQSTNENGLETRKKFLDLAVRLVVNFPGFKSPLPRYVEKATA